MTTHDFAFAGCRFLALYWAVRATENITSAVFGWIALRQNLDVQDELVPTEFFYFLPLVLYVFAALFLWFSAAWLARYIAPNTSGGAESGSWSRVDAQAIVFAAVGLFVILGALPELGYAIFQFFRLYDLENQFERAFGAPGRLYELAVRTILGVLLVFGARALSRLLIRLRTAGLK